MRPGSAINLMLVGLIGASLSACHDTCFMVVSCRDSSHIAVEGRVVTTESGIGVSGAKLTLVATDGSAAESTFALSDEQGDFALELPPMASAAPVLALRILPVGKPGYTIWPLDCTPVSKWGDACVLNPVVSEPTFPIFVFVYRNDVTRPAAGVRVTFTRTGGATLNGAGSATPRQIITDETGSAHLFPATVSASGVGPVIGDLTVELPPPIGTTIRHNYAFGFNPWFNIPQYAVQPTGPALVYALAFTDSVSGRGLSGVDVRYQRVSGIATNADSFRVVSNGDGLVFFGLTPLQQGTVIGDFSITPAGASITTPLKGVSLPTFDADSVIVFARWRVGATGVLYPSPPGAP